MNYQICPLEFPYYCLTSKKCVKDDISCLFDFQRQNKCPDFIPIQCQDDSCRKTVDDCPTLSYCPLNKPFYCVYDNQCKISKYDCSEKKNDCMNGSHNCPDGSCSLGPCGTLKTCTEMFPIKCIDGSCRQSPEDCLFYECQKENQIVCHFLSACITKQSLCSSVKSCPFDLPIKCPDDTCVENVKNCENVSIIIYPSNENCLNISNMFKCPGGLCVKSKIECPNYLDNYINDCLEVDSNLPIPCSDGECVAKILDCKSLVPCQNFQCLDRSCVLSPDECKEKYNVSSNCSQGRPLR